MSQLNGYRQAFLDWLACAFRGREERTSRIAASLGDDLTARVTAAATAGHVLDFDDTFGPGLVHLSAATAPAALVVGTETSSTIGEALAAYGAGFEAMAAVARASHPTLYERGWHPTAVTGVVGAATAAASLYDLDTEAASAAVRLALLEAGGLRAAFGSDGKSLQVGMAAAQGVAAARLAGAGARVSDAVTAGPAGFENVYGGTWAEPAGQLAIDENWIKAYPCCLQTHSSIEAGAAAIARGATSDGSGVVIVHPRSRQAAPLDDVTTGLEAKFSIPYTVAFTMLYGPPGVADFSGVDEAARMLATRIEIRTDPELVESEARLTWTGPSGEFAATVTAALGSPQRPMTDEQLAAKVRSLAGEALDGILDDERRPVAEVYETVFG